MTGKHSLRVRLTEDEKSRLQYAAKQRGVSISEIIQDYCKRLPKPPKKNKDSRFLRRPSLDSVPATQRDALRVRVRVRVREFCLLVTIHLSVNLLSSV